MANYKFTIFAIGFNDDMTQYEENVIIQADNLESAKDKVSTIALEFCRANNADLDDIQLVSVFQKNEPVWWQK